jgi:hypothetical protein
MASLSRMYEVKFQYKNIELCIKKSIASYTNLSYTLDDEMEGVDDELRMAIERSLRET